MKKLPAFCPARHSLQHATITAVGAFIAELRQNAMVVGRVCNTKDASERFCAFDGR